MKVPMLKSVDLNEDHFIPVLHATASRFLIPDCVVCFFRLRPVTSFSGGHRGEVTPVPIPNTEVKGPIAEGTAWFACGRVGRCRIILYSRGQQCPRLFLSIFFCNSICV